MKEFWDWLFANYNLGGNVAYYYNGEAAKNSGEFSNAIQEAFRQSAPGSATRKQLVDRLYQMKVITSADTPQARAYWTSTSVQELGADLANVGAAAETFFKSQPASGTSSTSTGGTATAPTSTAPTPGAGGVAASDDAFYTWLIRDILGDTASDVAYYFDGRAGGNPADYTNLFQKVLAATAPGSPERQAFIDQLYRRGVITSADSAAGRAYWNNTDVAGLGADVANLGNAAASFYQNAQDTGTTQPSSSGSGPSTVGGQPIPPVPPSTPGTETINNIAIPRGLSLYRITDPLGSDSGELFYLVGDVFGARVAYEIGDRNVLNSIFGGIGYFNNLTSVTQKEFDNTNALLVGDVQEIIGSTESLQAQYERDMRSYGLESPPEWLAASQAAMAIFVTAVGEGWSGERMWGALAPTDAFQQRFTGIDTIKQQLGTTQWVTAIAEYTAREGDIRDALLTQRGPNTDVSIGYVSSLIGSGWQPAEVNQLLTAERQLKQNPAALSNMNQILQFQGLDALTPDDFISFLTEQDRTVVDPNYQPTVLFEAINDALRFQALLTEGVSIDLGFASDLGTGTSESIGTIESFSRQAQLAAQYLASNSLELDQQKMGLTREDIIAAMFNEATPGSNRPVSETNALLEQFAKERSKAAQGYTRVQSYIDQQGRPITQGFAGFS